MFFSKRRKRFLALALTTALVASAAFSGMDARASETVWGDRVTVSMSGESVQTGENNFNKGWKFYLGTSDTAHNQNFNDSSWDDVDLPHDFSMIQSFTTSGEAESGFLPGGTGWYRKSFTMPESAEGQTVLLNFDGVYSDASVYVNGILAGEHHYGYTSFAFDISDYLTYDDATENVVAVKAVNNVPSSRWYSGSGIYRNVSLLIDNPVHVDLNGTKVTTPNIASNNGTVNVEVDVVNDSAESATVTVTNTVTAKGDAAVLATAEATVTVAAGTTETATAAPVVTSPKLWSIETPNLYEVHTVLTVNGEEVDSYDTTFGFRYFSFDSSGFHLNGENVKLNGVCMHHDQGALGSAAYYDAMYRQLSKMKDMGVNAIRTSHNPVSKEYIEICNELGLLVIEEAFDGWVDAKNYNSNDFSVYFEASVDTKLYGSESGMTCAEYAAKSMVKRDRNAPSIIAWSLCNEVQEGTYWTNVSRYSSIAENVISWIQEFDTTRPTTSGDNKRGGNANLVAVIHTITNSGGVAGFNYANTTSKLAELAENYGGVIIASETSSATNSRSVYVSQSSNASADGKNHLTSYDTSCVSWGITAHDSIYNTYQYDQVAGEFIWTGFDYIGEPTPFNGTGTGTVTGGNGATPNSSYFGAVETTGFEKDTFYLYRSQWNKKETTLHLVTAWDSDNYMLTNSKTPVWVYSNAPVVKLYRDGTLIGTATRAENTSAAGHTYYTYTTVSNHSSICTTSSGSGADGLYAIFNVAYQAGTLSAKAFEADGTTEITLSGNSGKNTVTTPGTVSKLAVSANNTTVDADGYSLTYIEVDVTDADGNLDTTATNNIVFSLSGNGEIVGVDNGDQATTAKYQQSSVLTSSTSANINAYAGKALAIVRSTEEAGSFTVNVTSSGLTGGSVQITTTAVTEDSDRSGLTSYRMVKDYSVKAGTVPELDTEAEGILADGSTVKGTIAWKTIAADIYGTAGDYTITGTLKFAGFDTIEVTARLHVIANVIAMRNISTATTVGVVPTLPSTVNGVLADGTVTGEFKVVWDSVNADDLDTVGEIVTVNGLATVLGEETLPVTCTIRVAQEVETESTNIAPQYLKLEQDIASGYQSDVLTSITNGTTKPGDNTSERWTNWNNRKNSATATLTMTWATAHQLSSVNIYYYYDSCCAYPENITFYYSLNGEDYVEIEATAELVETYSLGAMYTYTFAEIIDPVGLKVTFTQKSGTTGSNCVGVTELEVMTYAAALEYNTSADLSGITVDGIAVENFDANTLAYEVDGSVVAATTADTDNAGITVLPAYEGVVRILTISEDGSTTKTYEVTVGEGICEHTNIEVLNAKEVSCTEDGYTGDLVCTVCNETIETGTVITASHSWDDGVVTKEAELGVAGVKTYICKVCGETKTEEIPALQAKPGVSLEVTAENGAIVMTGTLEDYANIDNYYEVTSHGILYMKTVALGKRVLTVNSSGRTKVTFSEYDTDGSFTYRLTPGGEAVSYTIRSFAAYTNPATGKTVYKYSTPIVTKLSDFSQ